MWPHRGHLTASGDISGYSPGTERAETKEEPPDREFFSSVSRVLREKTLLYSQSHTHDPNLDPISPSGQPWASTFPCKREPSHSISEDKITMYILPGT